MIKIKGKLLMFDKPDLNGCMFPKDCKINIPDVIPICLTDDSGECLAKPIGHINSIFRNETGLSIEEGVIVHPYEHIIETVIKENDLYFGGNYTVFEMSNEIDTCILNSLRLRSVSLYADDQYGDESLKVKIVKEE